MTSPVDMTHAPVDQYIAESIETLTQGPALPHALASHLVLSAITLGRVTKAGKRGGTIKAHEIKQAEFEKIAGVIAATYGYNAQYWRTAFYAHLERMDKECVPDRAEKIDASTRPYAATPSVP